MKLNLNTNTKKQSEKEEKEHYLKILEKNLSVASLKVLADKSKLPGINLIIQSNKNLI